MDEILALLDTRNTVFFGLAILTLGSAILVAFSRNIIHATLGLLGTFCGVAGFYATLSADFLAAVQLLVYVGGTLTLILFAVMLTSRIRVRGGTNPARERWLAAPLLIAVLAILWKIAAATRWAESTPSQTPATARLGHAFLGQYLLPFELASLVLLGALVGAVLLARRAVRREGEFETIADLDFEERPDGGKSDG